MKPAFDIIPLDELIALPAVETLADLSYLPTPNRVDAVLCDRVAPDDINPTAFVLAFLDEDSIVLAQNSRRGPEIAGGHREMGETAEEAAIREAMEEIGCELDELVPIGMFRSTICAPMPEGYRYPYPVSCQQFFAARVVRMLPYIENDECLSPVVVPIADLGEMFDARTKAFIAHARDLLRTRAPAP